MHNKNKVAVVIHVHYADTADVILRALKKSALSPGVDIYVTTTSLALEAGVDKQIRSEFPDAIVENFDNKGRDILPFLLVCKKYELHSKYEGVLKIHGKHTKALPGYGAFWLIDSLNKLIPKSEPQIDKILKSINEYGVVGPAGQLFLYEPKHDKNHKYVKQIVSRANIEMTTNRALYFFGGSMLWMSSDIVSLILSGTQFNKFQQEKGQYDGTVAHAVERLMTIMAMSRTGKNPFVVDMSQNIFRKMEEFDISIDGLIRAYEEFTNMASVVESAGSMYTLSYSELNELQDKMTMERLKSGGATSSVDKPDNLHTLLAKTQEELALIKASKKYKVLNKYSKVRSRVKIPKLR